MTDSFTPDMRFARKPLYAVLFSGDSNYEEYLPVAVDEQIYHNITIPHGLDRAVAEALPGLWYCIHLPNDLLQLIDLQARMLKRCQLQHLDHKIILAPIQIFDSAHLAEWISTGYPTLVVCPDEITAEAARRSKELGFMLPVVPYSEISDIGLKAHWNQIHQRLVPDAPYVGNEPKLSRRLDIAPTELPKAWLTRQMNPGPRPEVGDDVTADQLVGEALWHQVVLAATAHLEHSNTSPSEADRLIPITIEEELNRAQFPVALALPGVASRYSRRAYDQAERSRIRPTSSTDGDDTWSTHISDRSDALIERSAIEFVTAHRAIARGGVGIMLRSVPQEAFVALDQLERHFDGEASAPKVREMLDRLNTAAAPIWTENVAQTIARASMVTAYSNFPIGLLRLPGDSEVLLTRVPIAYRPVLPLTRAIQRELMDTPRIEIPSNFVVLVAECIPTSDPVGRISRQSWDTTEQLIKSRGEAITIARTETLSADALRAAIAKEQPDFLVISAHGAAPSRSNVAGLVIGDELCLGPELGPMPNVVILSACSVAPRGSGAISVSDLLLREGAIAVLGTQVPVDVYHNSTLMSRFFLYIRETIAEREEHSNLLEVWHRVQTSNAVMDVLNGSDSLRKWGFGMAASGVPVLMEFMNLRSSGRLRDIYADTEVILGEIADQQRMGARVRNWFRRPGYVPESLFYVFVGQPERIYLRPLAEALRRAGRPR